MSNEELMNIPLSRFIRIVLAAVITVLTIVSETDSEA